MAVMLRRGLGSEEFRHIDWSPFRKAFPGIFSGKIISLEAGEGWRTLLWDLCESLETQATAQMLAGAPSVRVRQIKQKFGGLRFYVLNGNEETRALIDAAEALAGLTCEACSAPAKTRSIDGWMSTFCPRHVEAALEWAIRKQNRD